MNIEVTKIKDVKMSMAELVRLLRKNHSISRQDLAEQLKISRITLQNLESGQNVTVDTLLKVLQHFDLIDPLNQFFKGELNKNSYDSLY